MHLVYFHFQTIVPCLIFTRKSNLMSKEKKKKYMIYQTTTSIESANNRIFSPFIIVKKKRLNMNMYEWMYVYVYEIVSYRSCKKEEKNVINTHNIYILKTKKHVNKTNKRNKLQLSFYIYKIQSWNSNSNSMTFFE